MFSTEHKQTYQKKFNFKIKNEINYHLDQWLANFSARRPQFN